MSDLTIVRRPLFHSIPGVWGVALLGMLVLLTAIAILQFHWTNEASRAEELRIGDELQSLMMKWHSDLYGEFSAICAAIQVGPDSGARDTWEDYLDRYVAWNYALPHESLPYIYRNPDLVGEIYIWETNAKPRLFLLNLSTRRIEPLPPPPEFSALLARLQANSSSLSVALRTWVQKTASPASAESSSALITTGSNSLTGWQFDEDVPAIVHPIFHRGTEKQLSSSSPVDWIIITLDMNVLQRRVLPEISSRYFRGPDGLGYKVAVVRKGARPGTIYASDSDFALGQIRAADSTMNIFGLPEERSPEDEQRPAGFHSSSATTDWHNPTAPVWFPVIQYRATTDSWFLELQRRAGPTQSAISRVRRNNLALSALVLLLLALSFAFLTVSGYRAQKFARMQMDFVASISHELRTPLTAIFSAGENIKDGVICDRHDLSEYGSIVTSQSKQLMDHVDRILLLASIRTGKDRYTLRPLAIGDILAAVHRNLSPVLAEESCVLEEAIEPDLPFVIGDMFAVCACLENLITNAIKYGGSDRRINISAALENPPGKPRELAVSVEDRGIGITASQLKRIFEPFYRAPEVVAAQIHGTGLGLALARHLAEAMGGRITVISRIGFGSIFTLHLAVAPSQNHDVSIESVRAASR